MAIKWGNTAPVAFHARNLEVAEISEELWSSFDAAPTPESTEVLNDLIDWNNTDSSEASLFVQDQKVKSLTINVTQICNLACTYCAAGGDGTYGAPQAKISVEKTIPQLRFFLDRLSPHENFKITFLGGEPLLYPDGIRALADYVKEACAVRELGCSFSIVTNGTLFTEITLQLLNDINCEVAVSIDGAAEFNDQVRPLKNGTGSTASVVDGLNLLFNNRSQISSVVLHGVFSAENMNPYSAYQFYKTLPADQYEFTYSVTDSDEKLSDQFVEQMEKIASQAYAEGGELGLRKIRHFDHFFSSLDKQLKIQDFCGAGKSHMIVDARNNLFTCPWDVGHASEKVGQGTQVDTEKLKGYEKSLIEANNCQSCWARHLCGGGCMYVHKQKTGEKHSKDPVFCKRTRSLISTAIMYYKLSRTTC